MDKQAWDLKVAEYLELLRGIRAKVGDERTAMNILQEVNKDLRMAQIREERSSGQNIGQLEADYPATEKQKNFLKKLGVKTPANLTKKEASALIDEELGKEPEQGSFRAEQENFPVSWHGAWR